MKKLDLEKMERIRGGAYIDCVLMVAGFAGAVASASTGAGIALAALSFAGGVRSAQACEGSTSWFDRQMLNEYEIRPALPRVKQYSGDLHVITKN